MDNNVQDAVARLTDDVLDLVVIWSGEHRAYWRANSAGYCESAVGAGLYPRAQAENIVAHCGPEKRIAIRAVRDVLGEAAPECLGHALLAALADAALDREAMREAVASWYRDARSYTVTDEELAMLNSCEANTMAVLDAARTGEAR